jgi:hypothetical protein
MTVATARTINNDKDVARKIPTSALSPNVLTEAEGVAFERITGPGVAGTVVLSRPASAILYILADNNAGAFAAGGAAPAALVVPPVTDFTLTQQNANGVAALTEASSGGGRNYSTSKLAIWYRALVAADVMGGASTVRAL